ncbi:hypothetical protein Dimus_029774 [Dionaea muscipula]
MDLYVDIIKATGVEKVVNCFKRGESKPIRRISKQRRIVGWKAMPDEWMKTSEEFTAVAGIKTAESVNPSVVEAEVGLASPPLDEGAFQFGTQNFDLSQIFDDMDDDGNPQNKCYKATQLGEQSSSIQGCHVLAIAKETQMKKQEPTAAAATTNKPLMPATTNSESGPRTVSNKLKFGLKSDKPKSSIKRSTPSAPPPPPPVEKLTSADHEAAAIESKMETAKRKLREGYQRAAAAKRQRRTQQLDIRDLPKQGLGKENVHQRIVSKLRQLRANRRR